MLGFLPRSPMHFWVLLTLNARLPGTRSCPNTCTKNTTPLPADIIAGFYAKPAQIEIQGPNTNWTWDAKTGTSKVPNATQKCMTNSLSATEVKYAARGSKVVAIVGDAAVVINIADKMVEFALCLQPPPLDKAHTLELLPGNLLAVATSSQGRDAGIWIYDTSKMEDRLEPKQRLSGVRAIHAALWDHESQTLWVAGTTDAADGSRDTAYGIIQGYKYHESDKNLTKSVAYTLSEATRLSAEWEEYAAWWDGPHDLIPVPSTRTLLFSMDRDIHALDLSLGQFHNSGEDLAAKYLNGFRPLGKRRGSDGLGLPRSDIKSISLHPTSGALFTQAIWQDREALPKRVNILSLDGDCSYMYEDKTVYRSRWFVEIPGWPTA